MKFNSILLTRAIFCFIQHELVQHFGNFLNILSEASCFFFVFSSEKRDQNKFQEANFVEGSRSLSDLGTGSYSALHLYRVFHLAIYAPVLLLPRERCLFLIDFCSFPTLHTPTLPLRYIATGIVLRAIMSISRCPINVTYKCKQRHQRFLL